MRDELRDLRSYLQARYRDLRAEPDWDFDESGGPLGSTAQWIWQTSDLRVAQSADDAAGVAILDSEIAVCLYVHIFDRNVPLRNQVARTLQIRSKLLPRSGEEQNSTVGGGSWRVVLYSLVDDNDVSSWVTQAAELRESTTHFEEVPIDAVIRTDCSWLEAFERHGLPRLGLKLRSVLALDDAAAVEQWQSADEAVLSELSAFGEAFSDDVARECADSVSQFISKWTPAAQEAPAGAGSPVPDLFGIAIRNFRNIRNLKISFRAPRDEDVAATVIQGPNGSGKSSIFEALCISVCGTSARHVRYLADANRQIWGSTDRYAAEYLTDLSRSQSAPELGLNRAALAPVELVSREKARTVFDDLGSSFLSQEAGRGMVGMTADELGSEIASSFSAIASDLSDYVRGKQSAAKEQQREFNATWGLRATVTREETAIERVAESIVGRSLPSIDGLLGWLRDEAVQGFSPLPALRQASEHLSAIQDGLKSTARAVSRNPEATAVSLTVKQYLEDVDARLAVVRDIVTSLSGRTSDWPPELAEHIEQLGRSVEEARSDGPTVDLEAVEAERRLQTSLQRQVEVSVNEGRSIADRLASLRSTGTFLESWAAEHGDICPTCDSNVGEQGGILAVVDRLRAGVEVDLAARREEYQSLRMELEEVDRRLRRYGVVSTGSGVDNRVELFRRVAWLFEEGEDFDSVLGDRSKRLALCGVVRHMLHIPRIPVLSAPPSEVASSSADQLARCVAEYRYVSRLPEAWGRVVGEVQRRLSDVTTTKLPSTLQALWVEVAAQMTPAPWQYPGDVGFHVGVRRQTPEVAVVLRHSSREALADHILNGAEVHGLALAWFFTKYLTVGRFKHRFLVLDDPASAMDQPTFRDFCRLLETLLRLHRIAKKELSLVVLLHQDSRAVDAARATDAVLHKLRWNRDTPLILHRLKLHGQDYSSPDPISVISSA